MKTILAVIAALAILLHQLPAEAQPTEYGPRIVPECMALDKFSTFLERSGEKIIGGGVSIRNVNGQPFTTEMFITVHPETKEWTYFEVLQGKMCALGYGLKYKDFADTKNFL